MVLPSVVLIFWQFNGFGVEVDDEYGDRPADLKVDVEQGEMVCLVRLVEDGDKGVIHHDYPQDEEDHPRFPQSQSFQYQ
jgi:hypothetical protein